MIICVNNFKIIVFLFKSLKLKILFFIFPHILIGCFLILKVLLIVYISPSYSCLIIGFLYKQLFLISIFLNNVKSYAQLLFSVAF